MKMKILMVGVVAAAGLLFVSSCGKKGSAADEFPPVVVEGINVDLAKLMKAMETATPELQTSARQIQMAFRYRQYEKALMEIDKIVNDAGLTEDQKKIATTVLEQVKQVAAKAPPPPN